MELRSFTCAQGIAKSGSYFVHVPSPYLSVIKYLPFNTITYSRKNLRMALHCVQLRNFTLSEPVSQSRPAEFQRPVPDTLPGAAAPGGSLCAHAKPFHPDAETQR